MAESIFRFLMDDALSTSSGGAQDRGSQDVKDDFEEEAKANQSRKKSLQQLVGIQFTLAAMLKQSSIFTGTLGALFQVIGAFVDILLAAFFPLLSGGLKFIMKFIEPLKAISAGIAEVVTFVIKLFTKVGDIFNTIKGFFGFGDDDATGTGLNKGQSSEGAGLGQTIGNIIYGAGKGIGKKIPMLGSLLRIGSGAADFFSADDAAGKTTAVVQTIVGTTLAGLFGVGGAAGGTFAAGPGFGTVAGGALGATAYEAALASTVDNAIHSIIHGMMGRSEEDAQYAHQLPN